MAIILENFLNICQGGSFQNPRSHYPPQKPLLQNLDDDESPSNSQATRQLPVGKQRTTFTLKKTTKQEQKLKKKKKQLDELEKQCPGITILLAKLNNILKARGHINVTAIANEMKANHKFEKMELNEKIEALSNKSTNNDVFILIVADGIVFFPFFFDELKIAKVVRGKNFTFTERKSTEPGTFSDKSICNELKKLRKPWKEGKMLFFVHWNNFLLPIIWTQNPLPTLNKIPPERWKTSKTKKATAIALTVIVTYCVGQTFWSFLPPFSLPFSGVCENLVKATSRATSAVISGIQNVWKKTKGWATQGVKKIGEISTAISFQNASTEEISEEISQETTAMARGIVVLAKTIGSTVGQLSENMTEEKSEPKAATPNLSEEFSATSEDFSTEEVTND